MKFKRIYAVDTIAVVIAIMFLGAVIHLLSIKELMPIEAQVLLQGAFIISVCYIFVRSLIKDEN